MELDSIIKFIEFLHQFQAIERALWLKGREHRENDVEHSFQLALVSWYTAASQKLNLDTNKIIKYALIHDLVEVYAGDVDVFDPDPQRDEKKTKKEHEALLKLKADFPEFPEMTELIEQYEARGNEEIRFVYAMDKLISPINIYLDGGRTWHRKGVGINLEKLVVLKKLKIAQHPEVTKYFDQLVAILEKQPHLFPVENEKI